MKNKPFVRYNIIAIISLLIGIGFMIQMIRIYYSPISRQLIDKSMDYVGYDSTIYPPRGTIYDRSGNILATNHMAYEVGIDLKDVRDPKSIAFAAASILSLEYEKVLEIAELEKMEVEIRYFTLDSFVDSEKISELEALKETYEEQRTEANSPLPTLRGLVWTPQQERIYPENAVGGNILGFYNYYGREIAQGVFGVEEKYNRFLTGTPADVYVSNDPYLIKALPDVDPGGSLILTIDREIQQMLELTLSNAIDKYGAENGVIIVENPETGEILGMASTPAFDPNAYWDYDKVFPGNTPYNRAIGALYEPGSVFKVITMAIGLDSGRVTPETTYTDYSGVYWVEGNVPIYNWDNNAYGEQDMTGCMQYSLNVCLAYIACDLIGEEIFYDYVRAFGFGQRTGIDLAGEIYAPLRLPGDTTLENPWVPVDLAANSFGQAIAVTPIQMVSAISAVANDGVIMMPHIVKGVVTEDRQFGTAPQMLAQPISAETAATLTQMLTTALQEEASKALVDGYAIAGKTGTAEIATSFGYTSTQTNTSFVGWGPSEDPKFIVYVWIEKPETNQWGSQVAAPVFAEVVEKLVVLMRLPADPDLVYERAE